MNVIQPDRERMMISRLHRAASAAAFATVRGSLVIVLTLAAVVAVSIAPSAAGRGTKVDKTLHVSMNSQVDSLDPAVAYLTGSWQVLYATCVKLFNYPDRAAPAGSVPVAEAAASEPSVSPDGLTYTFKVPANRFWFSPPSHEAVSAASFQTAFSRLALSGGGHGLYTDVVSVVANGTRLTVTLNHPDPDIVERLALPFMCAVPVATPVVESQTIPSAGPYYVASADLAGLTVLRANPNYKGSRPQNFREIDISANQADSLITDSLDSGAVDYSPALNALDSWWTSFKAAHPDQLQIDPEPGTQFLALNSLRLPVAVRQAINYAIDRVALSQLAPAFSQTPADHIIPPGVPGFSAGSFYPPNGDPTTAAELAAGYSTPIEIYTLPNAHAVSVAGSVAASLQAIGLNVHVSQLPGGEYFNFLANPSSAWDIALTGWIADYLDASDFLNGLVRSGGVGNLGHFSDPSYDAAIADADSLPLGHVRSSAFAQLDRNVSLDAAPMAVFANFNNVSPFSARIGCRTYSPAFGIDLVALCRNDG